MRNIFISIILSAFCVVISCTTGGSHTENVAITLTNGNTVTKCEMSNPYYQWGNAVLECGTYFHISIREHPSADPRAFVIKCPQTPTELKVGDNITNSVIRYSMYPLGWDGVATSEQGSIVVSDISKGKIVLTFNNFNFNFDSSGERFGLNGIITFIKQ